MLAAVRTLSSAGVVVFVVVVVAGCRKDGSGPPDPAPVVTVAAATPGADPLGPCAKFADGKCLEREALFTEATANARQVDLGADVDSGPLMKARAYFVKGDPKPGTTLTIAVEHLGATTPVAPHLMIDRWEPSPDGWIATGDGFTGAEPGGRFSYEVGPVTGPQLIAVTADPPTDFRVVITTK